jgi:hypothetical protein
LCRPASRRSDCEKSSICLHESRPPGRRACRALAFVPCGRVGCNSHFFANCDFHNNGGDPTINGSSRVLLVSCDFRAGPKGKSLLPARSVAEGCTFAQSGGAATMLSEGAVENHFANCHSEDMPIGPIRNAALLNSLFGKDPGLHGQEVLVHDGKASIFLPGTPEPKPQLLRGNRF